MARGLVVIAALLGLAPGTAAPAVSHRLPIYRDRSYSFAERAADLVARMTLAEKASQMVSSSSPAIPRLGVHAYGWWNESLHGISRMQLQSGATTMVWDTTSYPDDLALGSSWDPGLMYREASVISDEAREIAPGNALDLDFFAPTVNLSRDPRWGRNDETFSEDPLLTAQMASAYVDGMEGKTMAGRLLRQGGGYLKTVATLKHYAANDSESDRVTGSSNMDQRTLREYYTAQFGRIVEQAHPGAIMSAYNSVNGTPAPADLLLNQTLARQTFGFSGYFTSDCDAIDGIVSGHAWRPRGWGRPLDNTESRAFANAAGEDLNCTVPADAYTYQSLLPAATRDRIRTPADVYNVNDMDNSLVRLFTARMELGEFDNVASEPWVKAARAQLRPGSWVDSDANGAVTETPARLYVDHEVADRTEVLLKNDPVGTGAKLLPLAVPRTGSFKVAVIGYFGNSMYLGGYSSSQGAAGQAREVGPYAGIKAAIQRLNPNARVDYYNGFTSGRFASGLTSIDPSVVAAAANYNDVIVVAGTDGSTANEFLDRPSLALPGAQAQLISEVAAKNPHTIAVLDTVGPVDLDSFAKQVPAIVWSSYNGERAGEALADVLLGIYDPSGHLPFTWYENEAQLPSFTDYGIRPAAHNPGRTYMYFVGAASYPFGYGLSYTTFSASDLRVATPRIHPGDPLKLSVNVSNTGGIWGEDLVQLYVSGPSGSGRPSKRLEAFRQVALSPGQTRTVTLTVNSTDLGFFNPGLSRFTVPDGRYALQIGSSATQPLAGGYFSVAGRMKETPVNVSASPQMPGDGARRVQSRVMFPVGTEVLPNLTVAMNDQALYGYGHARPLPRTATVRYSSDRPSVVSVARDGTIQTVAGGVATVTATVSYNGARARAQFVVRALSQASSLEVQTGVRKRTPVYAELPGFAPDNPSYDVIVPGSGRAPSVRALSGDPHGRVRVIQAGHVPGTARVSVSGPDGLSTTYAVHFARPAKSDEFSGGLLGKQWTWLRHDPASEYFRGGALNLVAERGDLAGRTNTARNLLLQPALGDWTIQSRVTLNTAPHAASQQAGIIAYQDGDDYLKLDWEFAPSGPVLALTSEDRLSGAPVTQVLARYPTTGHLAATVWLKLVKRGADYSAYFSADGSRYLHLYSAEAPLSNVQVGLFAYAGADTLNDMQAAFDYFRVSNSGFAVRGSATGHRRSKHG